MSTAIEDRISHEVMQSFWKVQVQEDLAGTVATFDESHLRLVADSTEAP